MKLVIQNYNTSIDSFIANQLSPETRRAYTQDLNAFREFLGGDSLKEISVNTIIQYRESLRQRYATASANRMLSTVRSMFTWLHGLGLIQVNPAGPVKLLPQSNNATTEALSDDDALKLIKAASVNVEHSAIVHMLLYLGLRRSELCGIRLRDISTEREGLVLTVCGKGGKTRRIPLSQTVASVVGRHISNIEAKYNPNRAVHNTLRARLDAWLFPSRVVDKSIHPDSVLKIVKKYCRLAGIKVVSPHSLRATAASNAIDQGCNFIELQYAFGWSNPAMVNRYDKRRGEISKSAVWKINYNKE